MLSTANFLAATLLKPNTRTMVTKEKWIDHIKNRYQIETIKATPY